jgi:hypothetical protein
VAILSPFQPQEESNKFSVEISLFSHAFGYVKHSSDLY